MIAKKKQFSIGAGMMAVFVIVLVIVFSPVFNGKNGLEFLDTLYNTISKGSAYYIPKVKEDTDKFMGRSVSMTLDMGSKETAEQTAPLFEKAGATVELSETKATVTGDLGKILENCLADADMMYANDGNMVAEKYGYNERQVLFNWWTACKVMDNALTKQQKFEAGRIVAHVKEKAVETSYNYYGIAPQKISERLGVITFSLVFYVIYTMWYGFAIMYLFEGLGLQLEGH